MAYSTTFAKLRTAAGRAVGRKLVDLPVDDLDLINDACNKAVDFVAQARRWPQLIVDFQLAFGDTDTFKALPADFETFDRGTQLAFTNNLGYGPLVGTSFGEIDAWRGVSITSGPPQWYAIGPADSNGQLTLHVWPTPDGDYTLQLPYRRRPVALSDGSDLPDLPTQLHEAVHLRTRIQARKEFNQEILPDWDADLAAEIERAARILLAPAMSNNAPLRDLLKRRVGGIEQGQKRVVSNPWV